MDHHPTQCRSLRPLILALSVAAVIVSAPANAGNAARAAGVIIGQLPPGPLNAITDVAGVRVGQVTIHRGRSIHTGVTAVVPHPGNLFRDKVPAGLVVANGYGKFAGSTQIDELGEIETPILLTNTLSVPEAMAASIEWTLEQPGNEDVRSVNAVVGETNDGVLSDIRARTVRIADARRAIETARTGSVDEGSVGAGTGTIAFGLKGGIGTASRRLAADMGGWTVGVLVQSNYGGTLSIGDGRFARCLVADVRRDVVERRGDGSVVIVVATDAPLSDRNLRRLAARSFAGIARTGSNFANGSGDYALAFSTHPGVRRPASREAVGEVANDAMTALFTAVAEATEEAVLNSLFSAAAIDSSRQRTQSLREVIDDCR